MPKVKKEVKTFEVVYECDMCDSGMMIFTGVVLLSNPPKYEHKCDACGSMFNSGTQYPTTHIEHVSLTNN